MVIFSDFQFAMVETVLTGCMDQVPRLRKSKTFVIGAICCIFFLLGLPLTCPVSTLLHSSYWVKSGIFGQTNKFGQRPCLFHISNIGIKHKLTKQTVKILMRRPIRSRLIWTYTVCKCVSEFNLMSEFTRLYPRLLL